MDIRALAMGMGCKDMDMDPVAQGTEDLAVALDYRRMAIHLTSGLLSLSALCQGRVC